MAHDTLSLTIEGPYPNNYTVLSGVELDLPTPYPVFMQCLEDTLVLQYNAPWAEEVNISALALDVVDVVDIDPPHVGNLMWLSTGENLAFEIQYVSNAGCVYEDTLSFRSLFLPEIHVFTPDVVCGGEDAQFDAEVIPGSTGIMAAYDWIQVNGPNTASDLGVVVQTTEDPVFFAPPPCNVGLHMHAQVTDNYGCVGVTPNPASGYASCPAPPQALGNGTSGSVATCTAQDSLATLALLPSKSDWNRCCTTLISSMRMSIATVLWPTLLNSLKASSKVLTLLMVSRYLEYRIWHSSVTSCGSLLILLSIIGQNFSLMLAGRPGMKICYST